MTASKLPATHHPRSSSSHHQSICQPLKPPKQISKGNFVQYPSHVFILLPTHLPYVLYTIQETPSVPSSHQDQRRQPKQSVYVQKIACTRKMVAAVAKNPLSTSITLPSLSLASTTSLQTVYYKKDINLPRAHARPRHASGTLARQKRNTQKRTI